MTDSTLSSIPTPFTLAFGFALFGYIFIQNAWATEDAYITFRSVEQLFAGNGLRWNPHERVQAFTHPLWLFMLAIPRLISVDVFINAIFVSFVTNLATLWLLLRRFGPPTRWLCFVIVLVASKSFIDFTSSGLENPLAFLLLLVFSSQAVALERAAARERSGPLRGISLAFALLLLTRHDLATLVVPVYGWAIWHSRELGRREIVKAVLIGLTPLWLWTSFSVFYYGFPIPNTAYAKLNTGISHRRLVVQGLVYLKSTAGFDPLLPLVLILACLRSFTSGSLRQRFAAVGIVLNVYYVVSVGGDFMAGRFLSSAFFWSAILLFEFDWTKVSGRVLIALVVALGTFSPFAPIRSTPSYSYEKVVKQVGDERGIFFKVSSLYKWWQWSEGEVFPDYRWTRHGLAARFSQESVLTHGNIGMFGYWAGSDKIIVDGLALTDPLLARLPSAAIWRIGHFARELPDGYVEGLRSGQNQIVDPGLHRFYEKLCVITQGDLLSLERFRTILGMNLGRYDHWLPKRKRRRKPTRGPRE